VTRVAARHVVRRALAAAAAAGLLVLASTAGAGAADGTIVGVERTTEGFRVSVDVPADVEVDLGGVSATVEGEDYDAAAELAVDAETRIERTAVLAIDTSNSMEGERFAAAQLAATTFLDTVPDDVEVGIVTFDRDVVTELEPTTDRDLARDVIDNLTLSRQTLLYDAVIRAVDVAGSDGARSVLVLSDGADTSGRPLGDVTAAIADSEGVIVDVVALEQSGEALGALTTIAGENGEVIASDSAALADKFSEQAEILERQVSVDIVVPEDVVAGEAEIVVTLPSSAGDVVAIGIVPSLIGDEVTPANPLESIPEAAPRPTATGTPDWLIYAGVGIFAAGLLVGLVMLVPAKPVAMSAAERVSSYTASTFGAATQGPREPVPDVALKQQASDAIADVLSRNQSFDDKISRRLEAAGSELKSSEWLLVHAGLFVAITFVGLLLGRANLIVGLIFLVLGVVLPWVYLGMRAGRRRKAFNSALPETLQLMSGSLSAGLSLMQSVDTIVREGQDPVQSAFKRVLVETRIGVPLEDALDGVADRFDSRDFRWVVMAIRIQRQVGGNLAELLETVAETMREREYMRRQVAALAAEGKLSAIVLGALPPLFLLYLLLTQGDYVTPLFTEPLGLVMLVGSGLWLSIGIFWMSRLVKVEV
jgi:tight adherence protein B